MTGAKLYMVVARRRGYKGPTPTTIVGVFYSREAATSRAEQRRAYNRTHDDPESVTVREVSIRNAEANRYLARRGFG